MYHFGLINNSHEMTAKIQIFSIILVITPKAKQILLQAIVIEFPLDISLFGIDLNFVSPIRSRIASSESSISKLIVVTMYCYPSTSSTNT